MSEAITLRDGERALAVVYPALGAWLTRYARQVPGHGWVDALHHDDAVVARYPDRMWAGSPVLFPHVSYNVTGGKEGQYILDGVSYTSPQHGFGRRVPWTVVETSASAVTLELTDSERTRPSYPFAFCHRLTYRLVGGRLEWHQRVENRDGRPMPFSAGFHPYLRVPLAGSDRNVCGVRLPACCRLSPVGQAESFTRESWAARVLSVGEDARGTIFLGEFADPEVALVDPLAGLEVALRWDARSAYRFLALWAPDTQAPFYCVEPWTALPNSLGRVDGEVVVLQPGQVFETALSMDVRTSSVR